jgi:hypothetical protein
MKTLFLAVLLTISLGGCCKPETQLVITFQPPPPPIQIGAISVNCGSGECYETLTEFAYSLDGHLWVRTSERKVKP